MLKKKKIFNPPSHASSYKQQLPTLPLCVGPRPAYTEVWSAGTDLAQREEAEGPLMAGQVQVGRKKPNVDFGHETSASPTLAPSPIRPHTRQAQETRWGPQEPRAPWFSEPSPSPAGTHGQVAPSSRARVLVLSHRDGEGVRVPRSEYPLGSPTKVTVISRERPRQSGKPTIWPTGTLVHCETPPTPSE